MKNSNGNLAMTKGDSESLLVGYTDDSGVAIALVAGDTLYFTVRAYPSDYDMVFQKIITDFTIDGEALIEIDPADTSGLDLGNSSYKRLYYDVQVTFADGSIKTIIRPKQFLVLWEVTTD